MSTPLVDSHSSVLTQNGLVCSASPLAGAIGSGVLRDGGNAFDAAVAVAAAECVTLPPMCGIGGEVFALCYEAKTGRLYGVSGSGRAPWGASREYFIERGYSKMPADGPLTAAVPGEINAWKAILDRWGTRKIDQLLAPSIAMAANGFPLPKGIASYFTNHLEKLKKFATTAAVFVKADGSPYTAGDVLVQKDLARSLERIAQQGLDEFYLGSLADEIASAVLGAGGLITTEDLRGQQTSIYLDPPSVDFHGHTVVATGLPSQGMLTLGLIGLLDGFDLRSMGHNTPESIHVMVEAKRLAFADRLAYVGDPEFVDVPLQELLSPGYLARRREDINFTRSSEIAPAGLLSKSSTPNTSTSYFNVIDSQGNAVSFIHSLSMYFGSGFVAGKTGVTLNDRAGRGFYLDENHINVVAPGKKTINTIHNYMVFKGESLVLVGGTPGGDNQPQWNAQVLSNVIDHGMDVQSAADALRWAHYPGTDPRSIDQEMVLRMEDGFPDEVTMNLESKGHKVVPYPTVGTPGAVQLIGLNPDTGVRSGGTDRRSDGYPIPE